MITTRSLGLLVVLASLCSCSSIDKGEHIEKEVRGQQLDEIKVAIRKVTPSPVTFCTTAFQQPNHFIVWTEDGKSYDAIKGGRRWYFTEVVVLAHPR